MKKGLRVFAAFAFVAIAAIAQQPESWPVSKLIVVNSATDLPVAITNATTPCFSVTFWGLKTDRTTNAARVWIGVTGTNDNTQAVPIDPGNFVTFSPSPGTMFNLTTFSLDVGTANDGVVVHYQTR